MMISIAEHLIKFPLTLIFIPTTHNTNKSWLLQWSNLLGIIIMVQFLKCNNVHSLVLLHIPREAHIMNSQR